MESAEPFVADAEKFVRSHGDVRQKTESTNVQRKILQVESWLDHFAKA